MTDSTDSKQKPKEEERGPVKVELVIQRDETGPTFGQKLRRLVSIGLAGSAVTATIGSVIARMVLPITSETSDKCEGFVESAVELATLNLLLTQAGLVAGGFVVFFLVGIFWRKKRP